MPTPTHLDHAKDQFEPAAKYLQGPADVTAQVSIAISLKRLADIAEKLSSPDIHDARLSLIGFIQNLSWEAGRSFQQGTRTDR